MLSVQGDSRNSKSNGALREERGLSWGMIVLGVALLTCAVLLYLYYARNTQRTQGSNNISNINRTPPANSTQNSQTTPSPNPSPSKGPGRRRGVPFSGQRSSLKDKIPGGEKGGHTPARVS